MLVFPPANTPDSLLKLACNYVVTHDVPFHHIALPIEICDALLKVSKAFFKNSLFLIDFPGLYRSFMTYLHIYITM